MKRANYFLLIMYCVAMVACNTTNSPEEDPELLAAKAKLLEADSGFGIALFKAIHQNDSEAVNMFISPLSVSMALGMTLNGTAGNTYVEMQETLGFRDLSNEEINRGYKALQFDIENADDKVELAVANSVWSKQGFDVKPEFIKTVEEFFDAETASLDFSDPETINIMNNWVAKNTNNRIKKIIEFISPDDVMFLINAVYFNGPWKYEFDEEDTIEQDFYTNDTTSVQVEMMHQVAEIGHLINPEVEIIELPYGNEAFSAVFIKPGSQISTIEELIETKLTNGQLQDWIANLSNGNVDYLIPKLELEYKRQMVPDLQSMGITDLFTEGEADFSNLTADPGKLFVSSVLHKTFLKMNEEGTEAAAVTAVTVTTESTGPTMPTIVYDEPYLLLLRDMSSGAILFMGKIGNPSAE